MSSSPSILIVDDDPVTTDQFSTMLRLSGFRVTVSNSGQGGLLQASLNRPDVLLVDLQMPLMDGVGLLELFRATPGLADVPAVMITGNYEIDEATTRRVSELGVTVHYKPIWVDDLVELVTALLDKDLARGPGLPVTPFSAANTLVASPLLASVNTPTRYS